MKFYSNHTFLNLKSYSSILCLLFFAGGMSGYKAQLKTNNELKKTFAVRKQVVQVVEQQFANAGGQYHQLMRHLPEGKFPKTYYEKNDSSESTTSSAWISGFYPGTLLYIYSQVKDPVLLREAERSLTLLDKEQYNTSTHDLGFMMYCSFGNALVVDPKAHYKNVLINSAKSLSSRFDPKVGCIKSWDSRKPEYLVIIDNMMNLELLFWATKTTGDSSFYKIAVTHANTTLKNHFREDYSSYHVVSYNPDNGEVLEKRTAQGFANESAWARGQAWGLYGYTLLFRETKNKIYLNQANNIAQFILTHPNLPKDKVPYWDFKASNIPTAFRDASAAAVMASAFLELCNYTDTKSAKLYFQTAEMMIESLCKEPYIATQGNGGFLLKHSVGNHPKGTEIDVPLTYADYYFMEALTRYKNLVK